MSATNFELLHQLSPTLSVGVLAADLMNLGSEFTLLEQTDVKMAHVDVMDGDFTPMMTVGPSFIKALKTPLPVMSDRSTSPAAPSEYRSQIRRPSRASTATGRSITPPPS